MSDATSNQSVAGETQATFSFNKNDRNVKIDLRLPDGINPENVRDGSLNLSLDGQPNSITVKITIKK